MSDAVAGDATHRTGRGDAGTTGHLPAFPHVVKLLLLLVIAAGCAPQLNPLELARRQRRALAGGDLHAAIQLGHARVRASPSGSAARYDLACALARAGDVDPALDALEQSVALGVEDPAWPAIDEDLRGLRAHPRFAAILAEARRVFVEGIDVPGTRTVVRRDGAMPVRIRLPVTSGPPLRAAVWLHPSGSLLNADIERMAPGLFSLGFAVVVPVDDATRGGWTGDELAELLDGTLPRLADVLDVSRPALLGFSAGGQAALLAWAATPRRFHAVLAVGAAPEPRQHDVSPHAAPLFVIMGARDPALATWPGAVERLRGRGLEVELHVVPDLGHELVLPGPVLVRALGRGDPARR